MSRTKAEDSETLVEKNESVKNVVLPTVAVMASTTTTAKKIGVVRYLQLYPQNEYVEAAMKTQYKTAVKTITEWDVIVKQLNKKFGIN